jgi:hypothetical protein
MKSRILLSLLISALAVCLVPASPAWSDTCGDDCPPPYVPCAETPDPRTPGFWKNHPDAWVRCEDEEKTGLESLNFCCAGGDVCEPEGCQMVSKDQAIQMMKEPVKGDKYYTLAPALIAAQLNRLAGAETGCVDRVIHDARIWACENWGEVIEARSPEWQYAETLYEKLDYYNNYGCPLP